MTCEGHPHDNKIPGVCVDRWTAPTTSCIAGHNTLVLNNIPTLRDCICECENENLFSCLSVEYHSSTKRCVMSDANSRKNPASFRQNCIGDGWLFSELKPVLPPPPPTEFKIGLQKFVVLKELGTVTWKHAKKACSDYGFGYSVAEPDAPVTLAAYLKQNYPGLIYYWLGGHGAGWYMKWNSGVVNRFRSLWRTDYQTSRGWCVYIRDDGAITPLGSFNCQETKYMYAICEAPPGLADPAGGKTITTPIALAFTPSGNS